jgi:hypothetical protein
VLKLQRLNGIVEHQGVRRGVVYSQSVFDALVAFVIKINNALNPGVKSRYRAQRYGGRRIASFLADFVTFIMIHIFRRIRRLRIFTSARGGFMFVFEFNYIGSERDKDGDTLLMHTNNKLMIGFSAKLISNVAVFVIFIQETTPPTPSPNSKKIKMYDKFPSVPDFGAFTGFTLIFSDENGFIYDCNFNKTASNKISDYIACLKSLGFVLVSTKNDDSGNPTYYYVDKSKTYFVGLSPNKSLSSYFIVILDI